MMPFFSSLFLSQSLFFFSFYSSISFFFHSSLCPPPPPLISQFIISYLFFCLLSHSSFTAFYSSINSFILLSFLFPFSLSLPLISSSSSLLFQFSLFSIVRIPSNYIFCLFLYFSLHLSIYPFHTFYYNSPSTIFFLKL